MAWEWLNALLNSKPATAAMAAGNGVIKGSKPVIKAGSKALPVVGNYLTGQTIGNHLATIAGADNPNEVGYMAGAANTAFMPLTGIFGEAFDTGYGIGEVLDELSGASKFYGDLLYQWDPLNMVKKSLWDKERYQDPEWVAARDRYLARKQQQMDKAPIAETVYTPVQPQPVIQQEQSQSVQQPAYNADELVNGIIRGDYDNGAERIRRLSNKGLSLEDIHNLQQLVNRKMRGR